MLSLLRRCGAKVLPSNSRVRRRRTSGPLQGLPASKPVREPRTLRILRRNVSASSSSAPPAVGTAACDFRFDTRIRGYEVFVGAKCNHEDRHQSAKAWCPLAAVLQCEQSAALRTSGAGSPQSVTPLAGTSHVKKSNSLRLRGTLRVFIPGRYSSTPLPG